MVDETRNDINEAMTIGEFFISELVAFVTQILIFFCVGVLLSKVLSNETDVIKFAENKLGSWQEFTLTLIATIFALGLLTTIQRLWNSENGFWNKTIDNTLLEFPRTLYLFGSSLTAAAIVVGLYLWLNPNADTENNPILFIRYSIVFAMTFFIYGCGVKFLLVRKTLRKK